MKLLFKHEKNISKDNFNDCLYDGTHYSVAAVQYPPQTRTVITRDYNQPDSDYRSEPPIEYIKVDFPSLIFMIRYRKVEKRYYYDCISLAVIADKLKEFKLDNKFYLPPCSDGYIVCTDHEHDYKYFDSLEEMFEFYVSHWWGLEQDDCADERMNGEGISLVKLLRTFLPNCPNPYVDLKLLSGKKIVSKKIKNSKKKLKIKLAKKKVLRS